MTKLSDRVRPDVEAAPWVVDEIKRLEEAPVQRLQTRDGKVWFVELPDGRVIGRYDTWSSRAACRRYFGHLMEIPERLEPA